MRDLQSLLQVAVERHEHWCAGQVLGARIAFPIPLPLWPVKR